jgi:phage gp36-like protein
MAYSTSTDLKNYIPESQLVQLTDDNDVDSIDVEKLNDAIRRADDFVNGHIRGRYPLPLITVPELIRDLSTRLAAYFLFKRSLLLTIPEPVKEDYKDIIDVLGKIQKGKINPFEAGDEPVFFETNKTNLDRIFTSDPVTPQQMNWGKYPI